MSFNRKRAKFWNRHNNYQKFSYKKKRRKASNSGVIYLGNSAEERYQPISSSFEPTWASVPTFEAHLDVEKNGETIETFELKDKPYYVLGREDVCDISMLHDSVSRRHAMIAFQPRAAYLVDLNSSHGTFLARAGKFVSSNHQMQPNMPCILLDGSRFKLGASTRELVFHRSKLVLPSSDSDNDEADAHEKAMLDFNTELNVELCKPSEEEEEMIRKKENDNLGEAEKKTKRRKSVHFEDEVQRFKGASANIQELQRNENKRVEDNGPQNQQNRGAKTGPREENGSLKIQQANGLLATKENGKMESRKHLTGKVSTAKDSMKKDTAGKETTREEEESV